MKQNQAFDTALIFTSGSIVLGLVMGCANKSLEVGVGTMCWVMGVGVIFVGAYVTEALLKTLTTILGEDGLPDPFIAGPLKMLQRWLREKYG